jgi:dolichyl-diphosphooligosaccharide--protein glycosyltransferase
MRPGRLLWLAGIAAAVLLGLGLRLSTRSQLSADGRVRALTSDDYYHLRRARFAVAHFPRTIVFDPLMNFPQGGVPIWPPLFDVALAAPSRALHGAGAAAETLEREAAWVPVVFAAGAIALSGLLGLRIAGPAGAVALAAFVAVAPGHIRWTQYGHMDQHVLESMAGLLVLVLFLECRQRPRAITEAATGVALALAVLSWQGAIYWAAVFALALFLEALRTRESILRPTLSILGLASAIVFGGTAAWLGPHRPPITYISFGFFQPLFLAALAGGTLALETALRGARGQLSRAELARRVVALAAGALVVLPFSDDLVLGLFRGAGYVLGKTSEVAGRGGYVHYPSNWLHGIFEARPILSDGPAFALAQLSAAFFLAPAAVLLWGARAVRGLRPGLHFALAV